jgi:LuxR family transcriptional regulator of csgAB operon
MYSLRGLSQAEYCNSLSDIEVCIVSSCPFYQSILADRLRLFFSFVFCPKNFDEIYEFKRNVEEISRRLYLIDCIALCKSELLNLMHYVVKNLKKDDTLVYFNLSGDINVEKEALDLGVKGFFYTDDTEEKLLSGLNVVINGGLWIPRKKLETCYFTKRDEDATDRKSDSGLTTRECELLIHLSKGGSNNDIAQDLCISPFTVKTHLYKIYRKINVNNRHEASLWVSSNL